MNACSLGYCTSMPESTDGGEGLSPTGEEWLTVSELARHYGFPLHVMATLLENDELRRFKRGGKYPVSIVDAFLCGGFW